MHRKCNPKTKTDGRHQEIIHFHFLLFLSFSFSFVLSSISKMLTSLYFLEELLVVFLLVDGPSPSFGRSDFEPAWDARSAAPALDGRLRFVLSGGPSTQALSLSSSPLLSAPFFHFLPRFSLDGFVLSFFFGDFVFAGFFFCKTNKSIHKEMVEQVGCCNFFFTFSTCG